jgi:predicted transcriptional regulator
VPEKKAAGQKLQPTSVKLDPALYKRAQHYKVESGKDLTVIINEALAEYLKKHGA